MQSDTSENKKNNVIGTIDGHLKSRLIKLTPTANKMLAPTTGLKKKMVATPDKAMKILNVLFLGRMRINANKKISPLITPCKDGVAK